VIPTVGDLVAGTDVTGLDVHGRVVAVHRVSEPVGPYSTGPVAVVEARGMPYPLVALIRTRDLDPHRR
jgi:hypothetical protein